MVHFVIEAVAGMNLPTLKINRRGCGPAQYPPKMMLQLLIYCSANDIFSSRRIERATYRDAAVRFLTANTHPDHDTICTFRRENFEAVTAAFLEVLQLARIMDRAEQADHSHDDPGQSIPEEIARREILKRKIQAARQYLENKTKDRAVVEQPEYEEKVRRRENRENKGREIHPPKDTPDDREQANLTDYDSRLKRRTAKTCTLRSAVRPAIGNAVMTSGLNR